MSVHPHHFTKIFSIINDSSFTKKSIKFELLNKRHDNPTTCLFMETPLCAVLNH